MQRPLIIAAATLSLGVAGVVAAAGLWPATSPAVAAGEVGEVAAGESVTFSVDNMTCALCPLTVKSVMQRVDGVRSVEVDFEAKTATVLLDPRVTSRAAVAAASTNAGYPAAARDGAG